MREKLLDLMKSEGLKPSQLAELLEINPAGISHILAGRNKPGFDLLQKILRRFPRINPDWLLLDSTKMYRDDEAVTVEVRASHVRPIDEGLFGATVPNAPNRVGSPASSGTTAHGIPGSETRQDRLEVSTPPVRQSIAEIAMKANVAVERIVLFYEDQTFECFTPGKH